ncbi:MAG: type II secretion system protein [Planctomycetota bacterium]
MADLHFAAYRPHRPDRGLTLVECAAALVIVSMTVTMVMLIDTNTVDKARRANNAVLAAMLANEIMSLECTGEFPEELGTPRLKALTAVTSDRFGDPETGFFPYQGFYYEVEKEIEEVTADSDLSKTAEEREEEELEGATPTGDEPKKVEIVRVKVTIRFPRIVLKGEQDQSSPTDDGVYEKLELETYVVDEERRKEQQQAAGAGGAGAGGTGTGGGG